jgi:phenylalanyl-tRNA synthetase alpha chain
VDDYLKKINDCNDSIELEKLRVELLGRNGIINKLFSDIKNLPVEDRIKLNQLKKDIEIAFDSKKIVDHHVETLHATSLQQSFKNCVGHLHPLTQTENQLNELFRSLGFSIYDSPQIETDEFCFERLNVPKDHPARGMQDSIYIKEPEILLRTQTSSIEARLLSEQKPPFKVVAPGACYRNEKVNKSNHFVLHQYQGVVVDKNVTMKDLFGTLNLMFKTLYGPDVIIRFRNKYYPEVEPGVGPDMQCFACHGKGCPTCKGAGWIEMGGAGMIHPKVLKMANIDPSIWTGFAFGLGLDRWTMAKFKIKDIRTLLGGNLAYKPNEL